MKLKSFVIENLIYATALGAALVALGIGFSLTSSTGEQSKLSYEGDLWCVSNYIEARDSQGKPVYLEDGRPRKDERLDDKTALIRKEQVSAKTKDEAENKARTNGHGLFEPSNAEELRAALDRGDEEFFKTHFNTGATSPGPCLGSGTGSGTIGSWSSQNIAEKCGLINQDTEFETVKKIRVNLTTYSPCLPSTGNTCDCALYKGSPIGGDETTADGSGMFKVVDGRLSWVKHSTGKVEKYVFAEPQSDHIIPWSQKDKLAIVIPGFNDNQPIHVRDHYAKGVHENKDFLDIFAPCNEWKPVSSALSSLSHATGGEGHAFVQVDAYVVDTTKPVSKPTTEPSETLPDGTPCPESVEPKPADGEDYQLKIAKQYEQELSRNDGIDSESSEGDNNVDYGTLPDGILDVPGINATTYKMGNQCNKVAAGMAHLYRTGKKLTDQFISYLKGHSGSTYGIMADIGTGVVDRRGKCASSDNWAEIRDQVVNHKNPVVLATSYGSKNMHFITIVGFKGDTVYFNDGSHFVGRGSSNQVKARSISISAINKKLKHALSGCRYLYAKPK